MLPSLNLDTLQACSDKLYFYLFIKPSLFQLPTHLAFQASNEVHSIGYSAGLYSSFKTEITTGFVFTDLIWEPVTSG